MTTHFAEPAGSPSKRFLCCFQPKTLEHTREPVAEEDTVIPQLGRRQSRPPMEIIVDCEHLENELKSPGAAGLTPMGKRQTSVKTPSLADSVKSLMFPRRVDSSRIGSHVEPAVESPPSEYYGLNLADEMAPEVKRLAWIGAGAGGTVYKGLWRNAPVAVKFIVTDGTPANFSASAMEALLSQAITHPNVVQTYTTFVCKLTNAAFERTSRTNFVNSFTTAPSMSQQSFVDRLRSLVNPSFIENKALMLENLKSDKSEDGFGAPDISILKKTKTFHDILPTLKARPGMHVTQIIMEYCDRGSLLQAINKGFFKEHWKDRLKLRALLRTASEVATGMHHLHLSDVIHGDLKPGNVLLSSSRKDRRGFIAKITDFGLSKFSEDIESPQNEHWATSAYMAPEVHSQGKLKKASDVYSYGVLLWQMCTGKLPFDGMHPAAIMLGYQDGTLALEWPSETNPMFRRVAEKCLSCNPDARPDFEWVIKGLAAVEQLVRQSLGTTNPQSPTGVEAPSQESPP